MGNFTGDIKFVSPPTTVLNSNAFGTNLTLSGTVAAAFGTVTGNFGIGGTVIAAAGTVAGALNVGGVATLASGTVTGNFGIGGTITGIRGTVTANWGVGGTVIAVAGTVSGGFGVGGAATFAGTATIATGTVSGNLGIGGTVTASAAYVGTDQVAVTREHLRSYNLLGNPGFEIWQRGTTFNTIVDAAFSADRWQWTKGGTSAANITQETTTVDSNGHYSCKVVYTHNTASNLSQKMEDYYGLRGLTVTFTMRVYCNTASAVRLQVSDGVGSTSGSYHTGNSTWQTLTVTHTINAAAGNNVFVVVSFAASCTAYLDNSTLVVGSVSMDYVPLHPADDLARCQRYYWVQNYVSSFGFGSFVGLYAGAGSQGIGPTIYFPQEMMGTPTVTKNGTWTVSNCGQPACSGAGKQGFVITGTSSAAGLTYFVPDSSDDTITAVVNP